MGRGARRGRSAPQGPPSGVRRVGPRGRTGSGRAWTPGTLARNAMNERLKSYEGTYHRRGTRDQSPGRPLATRGHPPAGSAALPKHREPCDHRDKPCDRRDEERAPELRCIPVLEGGGTDRDPRDPHADADEQREEDAGARSRRQEQSDGPGERQGRADQQQGHRGVVDGASIDRASGDGKAHDDNGTRAARNRNVRPFMTPRSRSRARIGRPRSAKAIRSGVRRRTRLPRDANGSASSSRCRDSGR